MVSDAERHRDEDKRLRELTDARNQLDTAAYQVERLLAERGDSVAVHEKARAENLVSDARQALKQDAALDRIRSLAAELQQVYHGLGAAASASQGGSTDQPGDKGDDVIDAEFTANE